VFHIFCGSGKNFVLFPLPNGPFEVFSVIFGRERYYSSFWLIYVRQSQWSEVFWRHYLRL